MIEMKAKYTLARGALMIFMMACFFVQAQASDPLGSDIFLMPGESRGIAGQDNVKTYIDPYADPLSIDPLMRPIDPQHSSEYLDKVIGREYAGPFAQISQDLRGNWKLNLYGSMPGTMDLTLVQNRDAVFGRGVITSFGTAKDLSASGWTAKDVLYLDMVDMQNMMLYRCTLTMSENNLSGSFSAYDAQGGTWSGTMQGGRQA